jgi:hypothetical protein
MRNLALENRRSKELTTRSDLQRVWTETGRDHSFGPDEAVRLIGVSEHPADDRAVEDRVEAKLTEQHAIFEERDLRAVVMEQAVGEMAPDQALGIAREMIRDRRVLTLQGGRMTTLSVRAQEQAIERRATQLAQPAVETSVRPHAITPPARSPSASADQSALSNTTRLKFSQAPSVPRCSSDQLGPVRES